MTRDEFTRRLRAYERGQQWAFALGALPLLAVYLLVHTRWLKPYLQDHKHLLVALLILLPLAWLFGAAQAWKRLGPRWLGLRCPGCGDSLVKLARSGGEPPARCASCDKVLHDPGPVRD